MSYRVCPLSLTPPPLQTPFDKVYARRLLTVSTHLRVVRTHAEKDSWRLEPVLKTSLIGPNSLSLLKNELGATYKTS